MKTDPNGNYRPNIGWQTTTSQARFSSGKDKNEAERRRKRIAELWDHCEQRWVANHSEDTRRFLWTDDPLAFGYAKKLAAGETVFTITVDDAVGSGLLAKLNMFQRMFPTLHFTADEAAINESKEFRDAAARTALADLKSRGIVPQTQETVIKAVGSLHQQIDRRIEVITKEYFDPAEDHVSDSGVYKIEKMQQLKRYTDEIPLANLDIAALQLILLSIRKRPKSEATGKQLAPDTCRKLITEFKDFLRWLDLLGKTGWQIPPKFVFLKTKVDEPEDEGLEDADTFSVDQLVILNRYATPTERVFLYLGLNAAYGADQSGRLKIGQVHLDNDPPQLRRVRVKTGVKGCHLLWRPTIEAIQWALSKHPTPTDRHAFLMLTKTGKPYWRKTKGGKRIPAISKLWNNLLDRVQRDFPNFPRLPFNTVRNTSGQLVRDFLGEEFGQVQLTHAHHSRDRNLRRYTNPNRKKLFRALVKIEQELAPVFEATTDPWKQPRRVYTGKGRKVDAEIFRLNSEGRSDTQIGKALGISHMTVYRRLKTAGLK